MAFIDDLTVYAWNWMLFRKSFEALVACYIWSGYGLIFDDDDGQMMIWCWGIHDHATIPNYE